MSDLYPAIWNRRTNRYPFWSRRTPRTVLGRLQEACSLENAVLRVYDDPVEVNRIVQLLRDAEVEERMSPAVDERRKWVDSSAPGEGIPRQARGPLPADAHAPYRDLGSDDRDREVAVFEQAPTIAVLSTVHDAPTDWVRAGQALQRMLLVATNEGLSASFMNQPLEHDDLRWLVRSPVTGRGHSQMLIRLGYGIPVPATPRRPVSQVVRSAPQPG
jgi:nitroreductase